VTQGLHGKSEEESPDDGSSILACSVDNGTLKQVQDAGTALKERVGKVRRGEGKVRRRKGKNTEQCKEKP